MMMQSWKLTLRIQGSDLLATVISALQGTIGVGATFNVEAVDGPTSPQEIRNVRPTESPRRSPNAKRHPIFLRNENGVPVTMGDLLIHEMQQLRSRDAGMSGADAKRFVAGKGGKRSSATTRMSELKRKGLIEADANRIWRLTPLGQEYKPKNL
jgi:hypothetical protein